MERQIQPLMKTQQRGKMCVCRILEKSQESTQMLSCSVTFYGSFMTKETKGKTNMEDREGCVRR